MSATARFYLGFGIALIIVIAIAFFIGYHVGAAHAGHVRKVARTVAASRTASAARRHSANDS